jgi:hypothetical protein
MMQGVAEGDKMNGQTGECPYCLTRFEIVCVRFRLKSAVTISHCPNCAVAPAADLVPAKSRSLDSVKKFASFARRWRAGACKMEQAINTRVKYTLLFLATALLVAAVLRHTVHVYGGFSREEIRAAALLALPAAFTAFHLVRKRYRR